jgi:hypothetical protein
MYRAWQGMYRAWNVWGGTSFVNPEPPGSQIGRKVIIWTVWCQIERDQHRRGLNYGSTGCTGGSECFLGEKRPNLDKIMRNDETTACKCAETQVLGKRGITREPLMIVLQFLLHNKAGTQEITS